MKALLRFTPALLLSLVPDAQAQQDPAVNSATRPDAARDVRVNAAEFQRSQPVPTHDNNDDRVQLGLYATYSKGLPRDTSNTLGEPDAAAYNTLLQALLSGDPAQLEAVVLGGERRLVNPQAGFAYVLEGSDAQALTLGPAPDFNGDEASGEMIELYRMSLVRDVRFDQYASDAAIAQAASELSSVRVHRGARAGNGLVTPATVFRAALPGAAQGPFISQFLWKTVPLGGGPLATETDTPPAPTGVEPTAHQPVEQRIWTRFAGDDRVTEYNEWLDIQRGALPADPVDTLQDLDDTRRYLRNGRDLAEWVHFDYPLQGALNAALIMARQGDFLPDGKYDSDPKSSPRAADPNDPYRVYQKQEPFVTFGNSDAQSVTALVTNTVLRAQWFQKWQVHRRLRPEEYGGRVHNRVLGRKAYPVPQELLNSPVLPLVLSRTAQVNAARGLGTAGTYLLAQTFPEGSPIHPAYASGHSTYIGAGVTVLKAFYADFPVINPQVTNADGTALLPYSGTLMMFDELDKLASNVGVARLFAGVHYRSDHDNAVRLGELAALRTLQDWSRLYPERLPDGSPLPGFQVRTFGGNTLTVNATQPALPNHVSRVDSFTLVNAATDQDVGPLYNGSVIYVTDFGNPDTTNIQLNVRANTWPPTVGSVRFTFDGTQQPVENGAAYALGGNSGSDYHEFPLLDDIGTHVISATPYSAFGAGGVGGVPLTIRIEVRRSR